MHPCPTNRKIVTSAPSMAMGRPKVLIRSTNFLFIHTTTAVVHNAYIFYCALCTLGKEFLPSYYIRMNILVKIMQRNYRYQHKKMQQIKSLDNHFCVGVTTYTKPSQIKK